MRSVVASLAFLLLNACSNGDPQHYLTMKGLTPPTIENFTHCYGYGCDTSVTMSLPRHTHQKISPIFAFPAKNIEDEKQRIIQSLQIFETDIGKIVGTQNDKGGTFKLYQDRTPSSYSFQQDCVDESTNTTTYLILLQKMKYLTFFEPAFPANRQPFRNGNRWWHQTAVIREKATSDLYAVDTWFKDNGYAGYIIPLQEWKAGWKPNP